MRILISDLFSQRCGILWAALVSIAFASAPGNFSMGVEGGPAFVTDRSSADWQTGYAAGGTFFFNYPLPARSYQIGIHVSYSNWSADRISLLRELPVQDMNGSAGGFQSLWEFGPVFRLASRITGSPVNFFVQAGFSWYIRHGYLQARGRSAGDTLSTSPSHGSRNEGPTLGGGISLRLPYSLSFEIVPLYHSVWGSATTEFISASAAVMISL